MLTISATEAWRTAHPGAIIGVLELSGVVNGSASEALTQRKREIEARLRERYKGLTRAQFLALPVMAEYDRYYTRFKKTYHVQLQLESIVLKDKRLPDVSPAVDANFMAEVEALLASGRGERPRNRHAAAVQRARLPSGSRSDRRGDLALLRPVPDTTTLLHSDPSPVSPLPPP